MPINLKALSARLGLSPTTVSRALSGYSDVSAATRERVRRAAAELRYQPSRAARQVALGRADAIGIVYAPTAGYLGNPSFLETISGIAAVLERADCDLLLAAAPEGDELRVYDRMVRGRRVDAMLVAHTQREDPRIELLQSAGFPFLAYGRTARPEGHAWFDFDSEAGARLAVRHLVALGHRRIACLHGPLHFNFAYQRHAGFRAAMAEAGLTVDPALVFAGELDQASGLAAAARLASLAQPPTAVVVDDAMAGIGLLRALLDARVAIGSELSVVLGEGVLPGHLPANLKVAAVQQPTPRESGLAMGEMLLALAEGRDLAQPAVLRQPAFEAGNSAGPPRR